MALLAEISFSPVKSLSGMCDLPLYKVLGFIVFLEYTTVPTSDRPPELMYCIDSSSACVGSDGSQGNGRFSDAIRNDNCSIEIYLT